MNRQLDLGALIEANRIATAPSAEDRERNRGKLAARVGAGIVLGSALLATTGTAASISGNVGAAGTGASGVLAGGLAKWLAISALVAVGGGLGLYSIRHHPGVPPTVARALPPAAAAAPQRMHTAEVAAASGAADREPPVVPVRSARPNKSAGSSGADKDFGRALALLRSARRALDDGSPSTALRLLDRYAVELPRGSALQPEYEATRVLALCAAGHTEAAEQAKDLFLEKQSGSPLADRVRTACGGR